MYVYPSKTDCRRREEKREDAEKNDADGWEMQRGVCVFYLCHVYSFLWLSHSSHFHSLFPLCSLSSSNSDESITWCSNRMGEKVCCVHPTCPSSLLSCFPLSLTSLQPFSLLLLVPSCCFPIHSSFFLIPLWCTISEALQKTKAAKTRESHTQISQGSLIRMEDFSCRWYHPLTPHLWVSIEFAPPSFPFLSIRFPFLLLAHWKTNRVCKTRKERSSLSFSRRRWLCLLWACW